MLDEVSKRGTRAYSVSLIDLDALKLGMRAEISEPYKFNLVKKDIKMILDKGGSKVKNPYWIVHLQSPTASNFSFHPARAEVDKYALWHNGMMESAELEKFKDDNGGKPWDTGILLQLLMTGNLEAQPSSPVTDTLLTGTSQEKRILIQQGLHHILSQTTHLQKFQGSFACLYLIQGRGLYAFRNLIAPMFLDQLGTVCSIAFDGTQKMKSNTIYNVPSMTPIGTFNNSYDPYGMAE